MNDRYRKFDSYLSRYFGKVPFGGFGQSLTSLTPISKKPGIHNWNWAFFWFFLMTTELLWEEVK